MTNAIFHSSEFEFKGIPIPEFNIESGKLIRLCVPNYDSKGNDLVRNFRYELLNHFDNEIPNSKWSKEYSNSGFLKFWKSITVEDYIISKLNIDKTNAEMIAEYLEFDLKEKVEKLILGKRKALAIKCDFENHDTLIFDYYGVGANEFEYLEKIVDVEIKKGKRGIVIDRLEFNQKEETNKNINRAKITVGNNVYKK
tara:strand:- start:172 stop:762 length:591 start_codon:yes stop_codon:yes gene_type:complete